MLRTKYFSFASTISVEADCCCYLLKLYPAAAGVKDALDESPYDIAVLDDMDDYFIRLLLNADLSIEPLRWRNLNYSACS
jgi:hypothetical protein